MCFVNRLMARLIREIAATIQILLWLTAAVLAMDFGAIGIFLRRCAKRMLLTAEGWRRARGQLL